MTDVAIPSYRDMLEPTLRAIDGLGGSGTRTEVDKAVVQLMGVTDEQLAVEYPQEATAKGSKVIHRIAFARSSLKLCGALTNSKQAVWTITSDGRVLLATGETAVKAADYAMRKSLKEKRQAATTALSEAPKGVEEDSELDQADQLVDSAWEDQLLSLLMAMTPDAFERLAGRLLREVGFTRVEVLGSSGDEGVDGVGLLEVQLLSFPVFFQCKRYQGQVGPRHIRDFRGAMAGRGDKGLFITTGSFTPAARDEAQRAGTAPIDLIDGPRLCGLLKDYGLGVATAMVEAVTVDPSFFAAL